MVGFILVIFLQQYLMLFVFCRITNGIFADYFTVACRTGDAGAGGVSLLLIEKTMKGVTTRPMKCSGR